MSMDIFCSTVTQQPSPVQQLVQVLVLSLNYSLPPDGLTVKVHVPSGAANVYASYSIPKPSYLTADLIIGGSGNLTLYIPYQGSGIVFISMFTKNPNTTLRVETGYVDTWHSKLLFCSLPLRLSFLHMYLLQRDRL